MAGKYSDGGKYEADNGDIHPIRVQPETLTAQFGSTANAAPAGAVNSGFNAKVSKNRRGYGLKARTVHFKWKTTAPDGYDPNGIIGIPVLKQSLFNAIEPKSEGTYLANTIVVLWKTPEYKS